MGACSELSAPALMVAPPYRVELAPVERTARRLLIMRTAVSWALGQPLWVTRPPAKSAPMLLAPRSRIQTRPAHAATAPPLATKLPAPASGVAKAVPERATPSPMILVLPVPTPMLPRTTLLNASVVPRQSRLRRRAKRAMSPPPATQPAKGACSELSAPALMVAPPYRVELAPVERTACRLLIMRTAVSWALGQPLRVTRPPAKSAPMLLAPRSRIQTRPAHAATAPPLATKLPAPASGVAKAVPERATPSPMILVLPVPTPMLPRTTLLNASVVPRQSRHRRRAKRAMSPPPATQPAKGACSELSAPALMVAPPYRV